MFSCDKLKELFEDCIKPAAITPNVANQQFINEAKKYNCVLLSKELNKQCKNTNYNKKENSIN